MKNQSEKELRKRATQYFKIYNSTVRNALKHEINAYLQNKKQKNIWKHARQYFKIYNSAIRNALKHEINVYILNKKQQNINNELKKLKFSKWINNNISERDLVNIRELNVLPIKTLWQIAKLRNINSSMSKSSIILALLRSEPVINERKYIIDNVNEIHSKINDIRLQVFQVSPYIDKKEHSKIRKRLYDIKKITKINRSLKNKLLKELNSISIDLKFIYKNMISDYRDDNYANINDIEYIFGDIDDYYRPVLTSSLFDGGYWRYHFRGDKLRNMSVKSYLDKIIPYLKMLIDENKCMSKKFNYI